MDTFSVKDALIPEYIRRTIETKTLELMQFGVMCSVCNELHKPELGFTQMLDTYVIPQLARNATTYAAKWYCPAELKREIRYPATWLDAVKERWLPKWLKTKFPVGYTVFKIYEMYPEITWPKHQGHRMNVFISKCEGGY